MAAQQPPEPLIWDAREAGGLPWWWADPSTTPKTKRGPVTWVELVELRQGGAIDDATLVWCQSIVSWTAYGAASEEKTRLDRERDDRAASQEGSGASEVPGTALVTVDTVAPADAAHEGETSIVAHEKAPAEAALAPGPAPALAPLEVVETQSPSGWRRGLRRTNTWSSLIGLSTHVSPGSSSARGRPHGKLWLDLGRIIRWVPNYTRDAKAREMGAFRRLENARNFQRGWKPR